MMAVLSSSIFSQTSIVYADMPFVLCPTGLSKEEQALHLELNIEGPSAWAAHTFNESLDVVFEQNPLPKSMEELLVNPSHLTDIALYHQYKGGLGHRNSLYFSRSSTWTLIRLYSGEKLILAQRYSAESDEELLYHIANVLENLKVDKSNLHMEFLGSLESVKELKQTADTLFPDLLILNPSEHIDQEDSLLGLSLECV